MADPATCDRHDRIEEQLRHIRSDMDWLRQQDVAILRQLVHVKRTVEDIGHCQPSSSSSSSRQRLYRSATVSVHSSPAKRSLSSQNSDPFGGGKTTRARDSDDVDGSLNPFAGDSHFPASYDESGGSDDDDDEPGPLSRSYGAEGARAALGEESDGGSRHAGGSGVSERQRQASGTPKETTWLSPSFYEEMLRRNVKIWKTVQLINGGRRDAKGVKLWS